MKTQDKKIWLAVTLASMILVSGCICGSFGTQQTEETETGGTEEATTTTKASNLGGISFNDILNLGKPSGYTVTYDVTVAGQKMTQTHYFSGERFRMDIAGTMGGQLFESRMYRIASGSYMCTKTEGRWTCLRLSTGEKGQTSGFDVDDIASKVEGAANIPTYEGTRVIAGVTAQCFKTTIDGTSSRYCVHPNFNIPLLVESSSLTETQEGYFRMIAKSFSTGAPPESVFQLPAEPTDLSNMCAQACAMLPEDSQAACIENCRT